MGGGDGAHLRAGVIPVQPFGPPIAGPPDTLRSQTARIIAGFENTAKSAARVIRFATAVKAFRDAAISGKDENRISHSQVHVSRDSVGLIVHVSVLRKYDDDAGNRVEDRIWKRQAQHPKFCFFDTGVKRAPDRTLDVPLKPGPYGYGNAFEHFLIAEIRRFADYAGKDWRHSYLRTVQGVEIDLILARPGEPRVFMEIKSGTDIRESDCANLARLQADSKQPALAILVSRAEAAKKIGRVLCLPWRRALEEIGL